VTPSEIDPATFRFVAQCLNHCATACPCFESASRYAGDRHRYKAGGVGYCSVYSQHRKYRGCRNSKLIINKNIILLKVIGTNFSTSQFTMVLNFLKVTVYIQIPALRDTLAEKHVTKILKRFTISAAPCSWRLVASLTLRLLYCRGRSHRARNRKSFGLRCDGNLSHETQVG
jgi:hypothetical protein